LTNFVVLGSKKEKSYGVHERIHEATTCWRFALIGGAFLVIAAHREAVESIAHLIQSIPFIVYVPIHPATDRHEDQKGVSSEQEEKSTK
jgi:uncharacterized membrane protein YsdA (DUF1294 family)